MADATDAISGCDPDRASFTVAPAAARDSVTRAEQIIPAPGAELTSPITAAIAAALLPDRRPRISARTVKGVSARYGYRPADEDRPPVSTPITHIDIVVHRPEPDAQIPAAATARPQQRTHTRQPRPGRARLHALGATPTPADLPPYPDLDRLLPPPVPSHTSRLDDIRTLMGTDPQRLWTTTELATLLRLDYKSLSNGLNQWAKRAILIKTGRGTFRLPEGPPVPSKLAARPDDVLSVMASDPHRTWRPSDIAAVLNTVTESTLAQHMSAWVRENLLVKTAPATYTLPAAHNSPAATRPEPNKRSQSGRAA